MRVIQSIETGKYFHIYNCGINGTNLFETPDNYKYFMNLYDKYIDKIANSYSWCLMPNHFHFLVRIKDNDEIVANVNIETNPERVSNPFGVNDADKIIKHVTQ